MTSVAKLGHYAGRVEFRSPAPRHHQNLISHSDQQYDRVSFFHIHYLMCQVRHIAKPLHCAFPDLDPHPLNNDLVK